MIEDKEESHCEKNTIQMICCFIRERNGNTQLRTPQNKTKKKERTKWVDLTNKKDNVETTQEEKKQGKNKMKKDEK